MLAPTPAEAAQLVGLYGADPSSVPARAAGGRPHAVRAGRPGPAPRAPAPRRALASPCTWAGSSRTRAPTSPCGRSPRRSRAIRTTAGDLVLAIVGGPSGPDKGAEVARLMELAVGARRERARDAVPAAAAGEAGRLLRGRRRRAGARRARSRSAWSRSRPQACGTPVIAADVGGLRYVVAGRARRVPRRGARPGRPRRSAAAGPGRPGAAGGARRGRSRQALRFTWDATTDQMVAVYDECSRAPRRRPRPLLTCEFIAAVTLVTFRSLLSLFLAGPLPAHLYPDLRKRRVDHAPRPPYSSPRSKQSKHRREETGRGSGSRRKAATEPGTTDEGRKARRGTRGAGEGRKARQRSPSGHGRGRKDEAGSEPRRAPRADAQGSPRRRGSAARRACRAAGGRSAFGRAEPAGPVRSRAVTGAEVAWST